MIQIFLICSLHHYTSKWVFFWVLSESHCIIDTTDSVKKHHIDLEFIYNYKHYYPKLYNVLYNVYYIRPFMKDMLHWYSLYMNNMARLFGSFMNNVFRSFALILKHRFQFSTHRLHSYATTMNYTSYLNIRFQLSYLVFTLWLTSS